MNLEQAQRIMEVKVPVTRTGLKSQYRKLALRHHPDKGGDSEQFKQIALAYEFLQDHPQSFCTEGKLTHTVEGVSLDKLGLGFPLNVSAKECEACSGKGYKVVHDNVECPTCEGTGLRPETEICVKCGGSGKYKTRSGSVPCRNCRGIGSIKARREHRSFSSPFFWGESVLKLCTACRGEGFVKGQKAVRAYRCTECDGIGEIKIFNPVLPRGYLR